jgi:hypothetical protein
MNIVYDDICEHVDELISAFRSEGEHCESQWFTSLVSFENIQSDFQTVCDSLIRCKRVLPLYLRSDPCVFIFRESGYYFRVRFLRSDDVEVSGVLILIDIETSARMFVEILEEGCDEKFVWSNIVDFCVCAVAGGRRRFQEFPASDCISMRDWDNVIAVVSERLSAIPFKVSSSEFMVRCGAMVIKCAWRTVAISYGGDDDESDGELECETSILLSADVFDGSRVGILE